MQCFLILDDTSPIQPVASSQTMPVEHKGLNSGVKGRDATQLGSSSQPVSSANNWPTLGDSLLDNHVKLKDTGQCL